ncbi:MAG TPA: hypothetical protein H9878_12280 [Candidatus Dietzia merdigallinarum]|nr:hypothetical protein [Candidatus Dietzia merdigallinarum]
MATKKVSELAEGDSITATGPTAEETNSVVGGKTYLPGEEVTVTGTVGFPDMDLTKISRADVGIVDPMDQLWVLSLPRESVVEFHGTTRTNTSTTP